MPDSPTPLPVFCRELMALMPRLMRGFARQENNVLIRGQITPPQFLALAHLLEHGPGPMKDISQSLGVSKPAATALVDRLIASQLVSRQEDTRDRRIVRIALTSRGKKETEKIKQQRYRTVSRVFAKISENDRQEYLRILRAIEAALQPPQESPKT